MKPVAIFYSLSVQSFLRHLHPTLKKPIREAIEELSEEPLKGKPLQDELFGFRSHRYKKYRVIYRFIEKKNRVEIIYAGPRSDVYEIFSQKIKGLKSSKKPLLI